LTDISSSQQRVVDADTHTHIRVEETDTSADGQALSSCAQFVSTFLLNILKL